MGLSERVDHEIGHAWIVQHGERCGVDLLGSQGDVIREGRLDSDADVLGELFRDGVVLKQFASDGGRPVLVEHGPQRQVPRPCNRADQERRAEDEPCDDAPKHGVMVPQHRLPEVSG